MKNIKTQLGVELEDQLNSGCNIQVISIWADRKRWNPDLSLTSDIEDILDSIAFMEMGEGFLLSKERLITIADQWKKEGEFEELGLPIPEIKKTAEDIGKGWLYCPICHEAWESESTYGMVECPGCQNKLHNPKYKVL